MDKKNKLTCPSCGGTVKNQALTFCPHCGVNMHEYGGIQGGQSGSSSDEKKGLLHRPIRIWKVTLPFWLVGIFACCILTAVITVSSSDWMQSAETAPTSTPKLTQTRTTAPPTETQTPTDTPEPTPTPTKTSTPKPTATVDVSDCTLDATYQADVTIPDNTGIEHGKHFSKTWLIRNTGTCDWKPGYRLTFVDGDKMGAPDSVPVPYTAPGEDAEVSVELIAPEQGGRYRAEWQMCVNNDNCFGTAVYVQIVSEPPTPTPTATPNATLTARAQASVDATATIEAYADHPPQGTWCDQNSTRAVCVADFRYVNTIGYTRSPANGRFIAFAVMVQNLSNHDISANPNDVTLVMQDGTSYAYTEESFSYWASPMQHVNIAPGNKAQGGIVFLVRNDVGPSEVVYRGSGLFESNITVDLKTAPR